MKDLEKILRLENYKIIKIEENKHMVDILKYNLREQILSINEELHQAYVLKELFLDLLGYSDYEHAEQEIKD